VVLTLGGMLAPVLAGMVLAFLMQGLVNALERFECRTAGGVAGVRAVHGRPGGVHAGAGAAALASVDHPAVCGTRTPRRRWTKTASARASVTSSKLTKKSPIVWVYRFNRRKHLIARRKFSKEGLLSAEVLL
jgi:hypothetical protein